MSNTNLVLGRWKPGEWPEYVTVSHEGMRELGRRYFPERTCRMVRARWDDGECVWGCRCTACGDRFTYETGTTWRY